MNYRGTLIDGTEFDSSYKRGQPATFPIGGVIKVASVTAAQLAAAPVPASPDFLSAREEDRIQAYFASGHLYAFPERQEPLI